LRQNIKSATPEHTEASGCHLPPPPPHQQQQLPSDVMKLTTHIFLDLLGVGELLENITTVVKDRLGLNPRRDCRQLAGKTAIVTGGNAGVGLATADALLRSGANVVLACRSAERGQSAAKQLAASTGCVGDSGSTVLAASDVDPPAAPRVMVELLDLASLASVRQFVQRWAASGRQLDLLVCNAGIMCPPERVETADGFELQFQVGRRLALQTCLHRCLGWSCLLRQEAGQAQPTPLPCHDDSGSCIGCTKPCHRWPQLPPATCHQHLPHPPPPDHLPPAPPPLQSNYLSHFLLANCLVKHQQSLRRQQQAQRRRRGRGGETDCGETTRPLRVIFLSSMTHFGADLATTLADVPQSRTGWHSFQSYCNSKLCTLLAAKQLDRLFVR
jgi:WW domain-containing oxidoreductase